MGAEVIAAASTQEKVDFAISKGASKGFVYPQNRSTGTSRRNCPKPSRRFRAAASTWSHDGVGGDYAEPAVRALNWTAGSW